MTPLKLNEQEIAALRSVMRKQTGNAAFARRARCVLLCVTGARRVDIRMTHGVRPHRLDTHMVWDDPDFEAKAAKVIGLNAATRARVTPACNSCVFWKTSWPIMLRISKSM